jgi:RHH-type rel operon transcriptional repressor/antitoxin RelB
MLSFSERSEIDMTLSIELDPDVERRLESLAARTGRSKASHIEEMINQGLEDIEDYYSAHQVLEGVRDGSVKVYSSEAARRMLGLDD